MSDGHDSPREDNDDSSEVEEEAKVHTEQVKERHTSHWDLDYMSTEDIEEAYREGEEAADAEKPHDGDSGQSG